MKSRFAFTTVFLILFSTPFVCCAQERGASGLPSRHATPKNRTRNIIGHVTDVRGVPLHDVNVRLGGLTRSGGEELLKTNLKGEFQARLQIEGDNSDRVTVVVAASKEGYSDARETATLGPELDPAGIDLVMRQAGGGPDSVHIAAMIKALGPALREGATPQLRKGKADWMLGCDELIERRSAPAAVSPLSLVVEESPGCLECRTLLSLALFEAGSWMAGLRELEEALKLNETAEVKRPEPFLVAGAYWEWRGETAQSSRYYQKALRIAPEHPLALEEAGRLSIQQKDYATGEQLLGKALDAGAQPETRLLRIRALLELGDLPQAASQMDIYSTGREPKDLPLEGREVSIQIKDRLEVAHYSEVKSVVDYSLQQLQKSFPELKNLQPAASQAALGTVLKKTGENVKFFVKNFPNTISNEKVHQERLDKAGNVKSSLDHEFQYLLLTQMGEAGLGLEESRTTPDGRASALQGLNQGYVLTSGFSACSWVFDPMNQPATHFRHLGRQIVNGKEMLVVAYAQKPETTRLKARLTTHRGSAPLLFQGIAWIDPSNYQIVRLRNDLLGPVPRLYLERQTTEIQYAKVEFRQGDNDFWLPQKITVTIDFSDNLYRNIHSYSNFRLFSVETREGVKSSATPAHAPPPF